jgi:hypothetical protein
MSKKVSKNGIHINGKVIERVSGPVSMYCLVPSGFLNIQKTILLFGDYHFSYENLCAEKSGTYDIYDEEFYKLFDYQHTDVFVEVFANRSNSVTPFVKGFKGGPMSNVIDKFKQCFPLYKNYKQISCPTKHIKWHAADARYSTIKNATRKSTRKTSFEALLVTPIWLCGNAKSERDLVLSFQNYSYYPTNDDLKKVR